MPKKMTRWSSLADPNLPPLPRGFGLRLERRRRPYIDLAQLELELHELPRSAASPTDHLRHVMRASGLSQEDFAHWVMGRTSRTLYSYLHGGRIPQDQAAWIRRLEAVDVWGDVVHIILRRGVVGTQWRIFGHRLDRS